MAHGTLLNVMWQPGWEGGLEENGYMCMYGWISFQSTWNYHSFVHWLYANIKLRFLKILILKKKEEWKLHSSHWSFEILKSHWADIVWTFYLEGREYSLIRPLPCSSGRNSLSHCSQRAPGYIFWKMGSTPCLSLSFMSISEVDFGESVLHRDVNSFSTHYLPIEAWRPKNHFDNEY